MWPALIAFGGTIRCRSLQSGWAAGRRGVGDEPGSLIVTYLPCREQQT